MALNPIEILINAKDQASGVFDRLNNKLKVIGVAIVGYFGVQAFAGVVEGAADFEQALSRVQSATGASAEEMERLKRAAEDAGANTKYTSVEAAKALENLAKAGLSAGDAIETLPAVLALAQAGDIELATASEYVTKAVMGMGLAFSDAARVADVLALGANATNTSVEGLAQALSYAAPTAQSLGVSLESTVAIIGKFADAGIDASRAGTALNSIMSQFSDPASKFRGELAAIGITTGDFEKALHQLAGAGAGGAKAINAVGLEAGPALKALLNQGMPALDELKAKLDGAAGSAAATAKVMEGNLNGALNGLSSAWDTVKNVLGTPVLPVLQDGVEKLAAAFRAAVADGTVQKFGEAIATAFQSGITWVKAFAAEIDFTKLTADLQAFAARTGEVFTQIGEYATNAGNIVKLVYGVMSAGTNAVLAAVYGIGSAFAGVASNIQSGLALIYDAFAKVTFGDVSAAYKLAADEIRLSANATMAASEELAKKSTAAFIGVADGANLARDGFAGLATSATGAGNAAAAAAPALDAMATEVARVSEEMRKEAEVAYLAIEAQEKKQASDAQSAQASAEHAAALAKLRAEYAALVAGGDLQGAADKLGEINAKLRETPGAAGGAAKAAQDAAAAIAAAYKDLGITTDASLRETAERAKGNFELLANSGTASARELGLAFADAAKKAIDANNGIAPSWVQAQAATRGYKIDVDDAGKAALVAADKTTQATGSMAGGWRGVASSTREATQAAKDYQQQMAKKYGRPGEGDDKEKLGEGVEKMGGTYRNKDGMTSDAQGNVQQQWIWTRASIIDYLKQAGLDDKLSEELAAQFVKSDGTVDYKASGAQKKWGGEHSTLAEALGKMVDFYKYDEAGKHEAKQRMDYLNGAAEKAKPAPAAPARSLPMQTPAQQQQSAGREQAQDKALYDAKAAAQAQELKREQAHYQAMRGARQSVGLQPVDGAPVGFGDDAEPYVKRDTQRSAPTHQQDTGRQQRQDDVRSASVTPYQPITINLAAGVNLSDRAQVDALARQLMPAIESLNRKGAR